MLTYPEYQDWWYRRSSGWKLLWLALRGRNVAYRQVVLSPTRGRVEIRYLPIVPWRWVDGMRIRVGFNPPLRGWRKAMTCLDEDGDLWAPWGLHWLVRAWCWTVRHRRPAYRKLVDFLKSPGYDCPR